MNYWWCIQFLKIQYGFEMVAVLVLRIFSSSSDFIMGVYECVTSSTAAPQSVEQLEKWEKNYIS